MNKKIIIVLVLALLLRLGFVYFQYSGDVRNHLVWGHSLLEQGSFGLFSRHFSGFNDANYPPVAIILFGASVLGNLLVIALFSYLNQLVGFFPSLLVPLSQSENMQAAFLKLPAIFADLGIGYLIYQILKKRKQSHAFAWSSLYLFNPAVIYISSIWGQIESIPVLFLLLSLYFLYGKKSRNFYFSNVSFTLAILTKQTALWLTPIFLILWWKEGGVRKLTSGLLTQLVFFVLVYLPFALPTDSFQFYLSTLGGSSNSITDQAFNLWYFIFGWATLPDNLPLLGFTVRIWSLFLVGLAYLYFNLSFIKNYRLEKAANYLFLLSFFAFFLQTRVHDRHLAPVLPFLLVSTFPYRLKLPLYLALSVFHMINLYLALRLPFI